MEIKYITKQGLKKLEKDLKELKEVKRPLITKRIEEAIKLGDLSENAEYHEAKDDQGMNEAKIREYESIFKSAIVVDGESRNKSIVNIGCTVKVVADKLEKEFKIVGANEAEPAKGIISNESPLGQAFMNKKIGENVEVETPSGIMNYKILEIK